MLRRFKHYLKISYLVTRNSFAVIAGQKFMFSFFLIGKFIRFLFFVTFLYFLVKGTNGLAGYNSNQAIFFFLTFNIVDILGQFLFREVYRFRPKIVSGDFDLTLVKPISPLFTSLFGGVDLLDLVTLPPLFLSVWYVGSLLDPGFIQVLIFILLTLNALLIVTAFHIAVLALGIIFMEVDHTILIYRDLTSFGRFPVDIYKEPIKGILTYLVPVGIMITFPAKALMGLISPGGVLISLTFGLSAMFLSIKFWNFALKKYTSAGS